MSEDFHGLSWRVRWLEEEQRVLVLLSKVRKSSSSKKIQKMEVGIERLGMLEK